ncbi:collagenase [Actinomadura soli]|nr:collagenase [Actinomadura soli]
MSAAEAAECAPGDFASRSGSELVRQIKASSTACINTLFGLVGKDAYDTFREPQMVTDFDSRTDYRTYAGVMFGINANTGGMYLEGDPAAPGNQARIIAHEAEWRRPAFEIWNLDLAVRYMFEKHPGDIATVLGHYRTGNWNAARTFLTGTIGDGYDADWQVWLTACASAACAEAEAPVKAEAGGLSGSPWRRSGTRPPRP